MLVCLHGHIHAVQSPGGMAQAHGPGKADQQRPCTCIAVCSTGAADVDDAAGGC